MSILDAARAELVQMYGSEPTGIERQRVLSAALDRLARLERVLIDRVEHRGPWGGKGGCPAYMNTMAADRCDCGLSDLLAGSELR